MQLSPVHPSRTFSSVAPSPWAGTDVVRFSLPDDGGIPALFHRARVTNEPSVAVFPTRTAALAFATDEARRQDNRLFSPVLAVLQAADGAFHVNALEYDGVFEGQRQRIPFEVGGAYGATEFAATTPDLVALVGAQNVEWQRPG